MGLTAVITPLHPSKEPSEVAPPVSFHGKRYLWRDALIMVLLCAGGGIVSLEGAQQVPAVIIPDRAYYDAWFQGDSPRVFDVMTNRFGKRTHHTLVHPLFPLASFVPAKVLRVAFHLELLQAVRLTMGGLAALWMGSLFLLLRLLGCRRLDATVFSLLAASSAAAVFWFTVPETWAFGSLTILLALIVIAVAQRRHLSEAWYVMASAATLSMTPTNWMTGLAMTFTRFPRRRALRLTAVALGVVLVLWGVEKLVFPTTWFWFARHQFDYFFQQGSGGALRIFSSFVFHSMVMPLFKVIETPNHPGGLWMSTQHSAPGSASPWGAIAVWLWAALLGLGGWGALTVKRHRQLALVLTLTLLGHLALHLVYGGEETFLYALHWLPCLVALAAFSTLTRARPLGIILAVALTVCAGVNNVAQFNWAVAFLERQPLVQEVLHASATTFPQIK